MQAGVVLTLLNVQRSLDALDILTVDSTGEQFVRIKHIHPSDGRLVGLYGRYILLSIGIPCEQSVMLLDWRAESTGSYLLPSKPNVCSESLQSKIST